MCEISLLFSIEAFPPVQNILVFVFLYWLTSGFAKGSLLEVLRGLYEVLGIVMFKALILSTVLSLLP